MRGWIDNRWLEIFCRLLLGAVFVYASIDKILHPAAFAKIVFNYQILPVVASNAFAVTLPWIELLAGLALILGVLRAEGALVLNVLLVIFMVAVSISLARGLDIACGCFSSSGGGRTVGLLTLLEDAGLLGAGLVVLRSVVLAGRSVSEPSC